MRQQRPSRGLGGVGFQTPELHSAQIHGAGRGVTIPTSDKQELHLSCITGATRGEKGQQG